MPMPPSQGMPMGPNQYANQGMPAGMMSCPCCGSPMPMPDSGTDAPNPQIPPEMLGLGQNGQQQDSGLLQALMAGGAGGGGIAPR